MASVPADALVHRDLDHGIGEYPKQIVASGVVLAKLTFGGGHHRPVKGGNRTIGIGPEGGTRLTPLAKSPSKLLALLAKRAPVLGPLRIARVARSRMRPCTPFSNRLPRANLVHGGQDCHSRTRDSE